MASWGAGGESLGIERIVGRRFNPSTGFLEYRIKWIGFGSSHNTWERSGNILTTQVIEAYEREREEKPPPITDRTQRPRQTFGLVGLAVGWEPERIVGAERENHRAATKSNDKSKLWYVLKYKDRTEAEFIEADVAAIAFPHLVMQFLQNHIQFEGGKKNKV